MIVRCDAVENYIFPEVSQLVQVVGLCYGEVVYIYIFLAGARLD